MVHTSKVSAIIVASAIVLSGSNAQEARRLGARPASQENLVNLDLLEADADFERLLGSTNYNSYGSYSYKKRGTKGAKATKPYGKGSKGDGYDDGKGSKGAKATKPYGKESKGDDGKGKGSKGSKKSYTYDKPDKLEKYAYSF